MTTDPSTTASTERSHDGRVVYRWPRVRVIGVLGRVLVGLGVLWVLATIAVAAWDLSAGWLLALSVLSLAVLAAAAVLFFRPPTVLELTDDGYRIAHVRGAGTTSAPWTDVRAVSTGESVAGPVLVIEGRSPPSVVPLELLGPQAGDAQQRVRALLEAARRGRGR